MGYKERLPPFVRRFHCVLERDPDNRAVWLDLIAECARCTRDAAGLTDGSQRSRRIRKAQLAAEGRLVTALEKWIGKGTAAPEGRRVTGALIHNELPEGHPHRIRLYRWLRACGMPGSVFK